MTFDLSAAASFMSTHGRILDQRRFDLLTGDGGHEAVLAALDGYRNPDGGYGWGLEPDFRAVESQPTAGMHAFEVFAEVAPLTTPRAFELCNWLELHTLDDGGLPFALPVRDGSGCAPWFASADPTVSAIQMTAQVAANAQLVARHDPAVAGHPWLARATRNCFDVIAAMDTAPHAYELSFALRFLDAAADREPKARDLLARLGRFVPDDGCIPVEGGIDGETLRPLDLAPRPDAPSRALIREAAVAADLERLARQQEPDGGWTVDFASFSPAAALEWRGYATVQAVETLRSNPA
ncbi:MAG: hypothetical protein JWL73_25 [Actinomycetia bacterium]|nr:hypothetical protein [Actinomycetes bacterium]